VRVWQRGDQRRVMTNRKIKENLKKSSKERERIHDKRRRGGLIFTNPGKLGSRR